jgi:hypothetical protein
MFVIDQIQSTDERWEERWKRRDEMKGNEECVHVQGKKVLMEGKREEGRAQVGINKLIISLRG